MPLLSKNSHPTAKGPQRDRLPAAGDVAPKLLAYCKTNNWEGNDPYDALNSRVFRSLPILHFKTARLALTQIVKRSPINLRPLLLVPKSPNSKGIALFLSALIKLARMGRLDESDTLGAIAEKLLALRSPLSKYSCWGYNFDWQSRLGLLPKDFPNIICTTFAGHALLDMFEETREPALLEVSQSAAKFILDELLCREPGSPAFFTYTQMWRVCVHNANLLGAAFLFRVDQVSGQLAFREQALEAVRYSIGKQHSDGSWDYGESPTQKWIDNFHTGYNLVALKRIKEYGGTVEFDEPVRRGLEFFKAHFFREDGAPKYFHNAVYPIDIHCLSQSIITLVELRDLDKKNTDLALSVLNWGLANLWDKRGFFYYQKFPHHTVRMPFMRWSQAWMLLAIATLLEKGPYA